MSMTKVDQKEIDNTTDDFEPGFDEEDVEDEKGQWIHQPIICSLASFDFKFLERINSIRNNTI